jgi:hypothetical protein
MIPVRTRRSSIVYRGPSPDVGDAWVERVVADNALYLTWKPSPDEIEQIAEGALIRLGIFGTGGRLTPVSLGIDPDPELSPQAAVLRDRAREILRLATGPNVTPAGHWLASADLWGALCETGALDSGVGVPTLLGRPLMELTEGVLEDYLEYAVAVP